MRMPAVLLLLIALAGLGCGRKNAAEPMAEPTVKKGLGTFTIGAATTYVTGPIEADGHVNYANALNDRLRLGVTPENNAAVLLWKTLGPHPARTTFPPGFFELLEIQVPEPGGCFQPFQEFFQNRLRIDSSFIPGYSSQLGVLAQRPWTPNRFAEFNAWLEANEQPLALLVEATKRTRYYSPMIPTSGTEGLDGLLSVTIPGALAFRELADALLVRAMLRIGQNKVDAAWQDLLACHRLARLVSHGGSLIESLIGVVIENKACLGDLAFLEWTQPDAKQVEARMRELRSLPPAAELADKVSLGDRFTMLEHVMLIDRDGLKHLSKGKGSSTNRIGDIGLEGIDWDPALEAINKQFNDLSAAMRVKKRSERAAQINQFWAELSGLSDEISDPANRLAELSHEGKESAKAKGQVVGEILITLLLPAFNKVQDARDRSTQTMDNLFVAFALAAYRSEHATYPESLDLLAPNYLSSVPEDQFSDKPLIYRVQGDGYILYSVGLNGTDDGGRTWREDPKYDDLVVQMPLPPLK